MPASSMVEAFSRALRGTTLQPGDAGYDEARTVWNGMIDRRPAIIVRCLSAEDVAGAVRFAARHDLPVSVKGGGHGVAGAAVCDDGLMIDLSAMNGVEVDPETRTARVGPGARWNEFDGKAQQVGLATTGGVHSRTGVAGLTLGGGVGYLARRHGLSADNLRSAEVVVGDGEIVRASEDDNADLLWGLRGAGQGLGVVTSFEFDLHPVGPEVATVQAFHRLDDAPAALRFYRDFMADAPDALTCNALIVPAPPVEPFPEDLHGAPVLALVACYAGTVEEGRDRLSALEGYGDPVVNVAAPIAYATLQSSFDDGAPDGGRYYWKSHYLEELSDATIDTVLGDPQLLPGPLSMIGIEPLGGAVGRVEPTATAFPHRDAGFSLGIWSGWTDPSDDERVITATRDLHTAIAPHATGGMYANYAGSDDAHRTDAIYGTNADRVGELRARYGL